MPQQTFALRHDLKLRRMDGDFITFECRGQEITISSPISTGPILNVNDLNELQQTLAQSLEAKELRQFERTMLSLGLALSDNDAGFQFPAICDLVLPDGSNGRPKSWPDVHLSDLESDTRVDLLIHVSFHQDFESLKLLAEAIKHLTIPVLMVLVQPEGFILGPLITPKKPWICVECLSKKIQDMTPDHSGLQYLSAENTKVSYWPVELRDQLYGTLAVEVENIKDPLCRERLRRGCFSFNLEKATSTYEMLLPEPNCEMCRSSLQQNGKDPVAVFSPF